MCVCFLCAWCVCVRKKNWNLSVWQYLRTKIKLGLIWISWRLNDAQNLELMFCVGILFVRSHIHKNTSIAEIVRERQRKHHHKRTIKWKRNDRRLYSCSVAMVYSNNSGLDELTNERDFVCLCMLNSTKTITVHNTKMCVWERKCTNVFGQSPQINTTGKVCKI